MPDDTILATARLVKPVAFDLRPDEKLRSEIAARLDLLGLRKLGFTGSVAPAAAQDVKLDATLGATVVQPCVVTGEPVTTRIDVPVLRLYLAQMDDPEGDEVEMPEDDSAEPLPASINLVAVMEEALVLALPDWPRADGVEPVDLTVTEPGVAPMTEEDTKPFAGLKSLRDKLTDSGEDT